MIEMRYDSYYFGGFSMPHDGIQPQWPVPATQAIVFNFTN